MKREFAISMCAAVLLLVSPSLIRARENSNTNPRASALSSTNNANSARDQRLAEQMVPAHAMLLHKLDARKSQPGDTIQARLQRTVQFKNGRELPDGTMLIGKVITDNTAQKSAKLAIRFDQAKLKDGSIVHIKTMIVAIQPGEETNLNPEDYDRVPTTDLWTPHTYRIDQIGAVAGADLHSNVASNNSATISTDKKNNIVINSGSEIDMAIRPS